MSKTKDDGTTPLTITLLDQSTLEHCEECLQLESKLPFLNKQSHHYWIKYMQLKQLYQSIGMTIVAAYQNREKYQEE